MAGPAVALMAAGLVTGAGGAWLKGNAADLAKRKYEEAANMPGLDINKISGESLDSLYSQIPNAARSTNLINQTNLDQLNQMWGQVPGANQMQAQQATNINDWLKGNMSKEITDQVHRSAAVRAIGGGYGGSGMMRNLVARDLGMTGYGMQQAAMPMANQYQQTQFQTRLPQLARIQDYTVNPNTWLGIREQERAKQQMMLGNLAGMPGKTSVWGEYFTGMGGALMGGAGGMGGAASSLMGGGK
jgi:hypothetical protein